MAYNSSAVLFLFKPENIFFLHYLRLIFFLSFSAPKLEENVQLDYLKPYKWDNSNAGYFYYIFLLLIFTSLFLVVYFVGSLSQLNYVILASLQ